LSITGESVRDLFRKREDDLSLSIEDLITNLRVVNKDNKTLKAIIKALQIG
jgi:hypothetical protein